MHVIHVRNVNHAYVAGMNYLYEHGESLPSRNGRVIRAPGPVTTIYDRPWERVLFNPARNCNPFFHYMEALWMLAGRNDVASVATFNKRMVEFSDDGVRFEGAYGYRWRSYFGRDQLKEAIERLKKDKFDRRVVVGMWDPDADMFRQNSKDVPCNLSLKFFTTKPDTLNMICFNRSNDIIWGAYGANAVHMSVVHQYVADMCGMGMGKYYQISSDFHAYDQIFTELYPSVNVNANPCPYTNGENLADGSLVWDIESFEHELQLVVDAMSTGEYPDPRPFYNGSLRDAVYMGLSWNHHKLKEYGKRNMLIQMVAVSDWREACQQWFARRDAV